MYTSFTDQWQTLLDENGKPLIGRVKFFNADSRQYKSIFYDMQGETQGENPQYTLQDGRLEHQVFIGAGVYTCKVEKFVGTDVSSMRDHANDDTYWHPYKEFKIYGGAEEVEGGSDLAAGFCDTIAALRLVNPSEHGVVSVIGYYSKEDGIEPRTYIWVEGNNDAEDYGSTIISSVTGYTSAGRWKLCESPIVCATTFGVFPDIASTTTASDLSDKATALASYANNSPLVQSIFFKSGHYVFASGTRLTFLKPVSTGSTETNKIKFDMDGWDADVLPVGTIEITFAGGFETQQNDKLSNNFIKTLISFGKGLFKTSWIDGEQNCINACANFAGLVCFLNDNKTSSISDTGKTFKNWKFVGSETNTNHRTIAANTTFKDCEFVGKCFSNCGTGVSFFDCGTINQNQLNDRNKYFHAMNIWNADGTPKSYGTHFIISFLVVAGITFTGDLDNSVVTPVNGATFTSTQNLTLKYFNENWKLDGHIDFSDSYDILLKMYENSDDAVNVMLDAPSKVLNLQGNSASYTREMSNTAKSFRIKNGQFFTYERSGTGSAIDEINIENCGLSCAYGNLVIQAKNSSLVNFNNGAEPVSVNLRNCYVATAQNVSLYVNECYAEGCSFNGGVKLKANSNNRLEQKFIGCDFNDTIALETANNAVTICDVVVKGCCFNINNSGTPIQAISTSVLGNGSWANESLQGYQFDGNTFIGDARLLPTKKVKFKLTSSTDGSTTPTASDGEVSIGSLTNYTYQAISTISGRLLAWANKFNDFSFFANKLFHLGIIDNFSIVAKPLTQLRECYFGQGDKAQILPISEMVQLATNANVTSISQAIYVNYGDDVSISDYSTFIPQIEWLVEFEKM